MNNFIVPVAPLFRHKEKGGKYRVLTTAMGAGELHGRAVVIYTNAEKVEGAIYVRLLAEWDDKMEEIENG